MLLVSSLFRKDRTVTTSSAPGSQTHGTDQETHHIHNCQQPLIKAVPMKTVTQDGGLHATHRPVPNPTASRGSFLKHKERVASPVAIQAKSNNFNPVYNSGLKAPVTRMSSAAHMSTRRPLSISTL